MRTIALLAPYTLFNILHSREVFLIENPSAFSIVKEVILFEWQVTAMCSLTPP